MVPAMNRRDFLSLCGLASGACLIPPRIAQVIRDTCVLAGKPYLINAPAEGSLIYAVNQGRNFMLFDGDPNEPTAVP